MIYFVNMVSRRRISYAAGDAFEPKGLSAIFMCLVELEVVQLLAIP